MAFDPNDRRSTIGSTQGVQPPSERGVDRAREDYMDDLSKGNIREAADDQPVASTGERTYAPASERVPRTPRPGDAELVTHPDTSTPERRAAGFDTGPSTSSASFADVSSWQAEERSGRWLGWGSAGAVAATVGLAAGAAWLYRRREEERRRPMNRVRRGLQRAGSAVGDRWERLPLDRLPEGGRLVEYVQQVPSSEYGRPAGGAGAALLVGGLLLNWLLRSRRHDPPAAQAMDAAAGIDWKALRRSARQLNGERVSDAMGDFRSGWARLEMPSKDEALEQAGRLSRRATQALPEARAGAADVPWRVVGGALVVGAVGYLLGRAFGGGHQHPRDEPNPAVGSTIGTTGSSAAAGYPLS